jgi:hypothetical protein
MALHDEILRDILAGRVPRRFKIADLKTISGTRPRYYRVGNGEYAENAINTIPRNHSVRMFEGVGRRHSGGMARANTS